MQERPKIGGLRGSRPSPLRNMQDSISVSGLSTCAPKTGSARENVRLVSEQPKYASRCDRVGRDGHCWQS
jgi:hypothetical protein